MPQIELPLSLESALRLRVAMLEVEVARLHLALVQQRHDTTLAALLAMVPAGVPPPSGPVHLDLETGCLSYAVPDATEAVDTSAPTV